MAEKLSGMEMMIQSLMKAAGFNPKEITEATVMVVKQMQDGLTTLNQNMGHLLREAQIAKLERRAIMDQLGIQVAPENATALLTNGKDTHNEHI